MTTEGKGTNETKGTSTEMRLLIIAVVVPIVIALLVTGVPVIWKGLTKVLSTVIPNIWVFLLYLYFGFMAFLLGRISKKVKK